jgi:hypothetical protein
VIDGKHNDTDGSVNRGKKSNLDVKLGRFFFQGPNREADFKAVSNREFSLLQMLTGTRKETAKINQLHRTCFGAQGNQLMQYALRTEVMRCEVLLFISTIRDIGNDITATNTMMLVEVGDVKVVSLGRLEGLDGSCGVRHY